ncbi:MAG: hypothetical protein CM15mV94_040 [uncultured marine virus]|nr:MAG: hypothetical protein CM15mV94_040 [uncultured marine virus]
MLKKVMEKTLVVVKLRLLRIGTMVGLYSTTRIATLGSKFIDLNSTY